MPLVEGAFPAVRAFKGKASFWELRFAALPSVHTRLKGHVAVSERFIALRTVEHPSRHCANFLFLDENASGCERLGELRLFPSYTLSLFVGG